MEEKGDWRVGVNVRKEGLEGWSKCMKRGIGGLD